MPFKKIASKVGFTTALIIFVFGGITILLTHVLVYHQLSTQSELDLFALNKSSAISFAEKFGHSQSLVSTIATDPDVVEFSVKNATASADSQITTILGKYNIQNYYSAIYIVSNSGIALASTDQSFVAQDYSFRLYYQSAITGVPYTDVNYGVTSKKLGYYFSHPIKNSSGEVVGVAVVKLDTFPIAKLLKNFIGDETSDLMLVDRYGTVIEAHKKHRVLASLGVPTEATIQKIKEEKKYSDQTIRPLQYQHLQSLIDAGLTQSHHLIISDHLDNEDESLFITPIPNTTFFLISEINREHIVSAAASTSLIISIMIGFAVVTTVIILQILLSITLSPISTLSQMAQSISQGYFDVTNTLRTNDELASLGHAMESMASSLKNKYDDLEKIVSERTKELQSKTKTLSRSQAAIQNLLEDTQQAREEAEVMANDLVKFQKAVEGASDHIVITDPDGIILYANSAVTSLTGYSNKEIVGKKAGSPELWGGQMDKNFYKLLWHTIKVEKKIFSGEITNRRKNGQNYIALSSISPILNKKKEVIFFVGIERDATVEREVDRMKTEFVSFASHQLRTPLSAMKWFSEMLLSGDAGKLSKEQKEFVQNIYDSNERMTSLVKDLLDISRIESGRIIIDPKPTSMLDLARGVLLEVTPRAKQKKQKIITSFHDKLPLINLDSTLIRNAFLNLITNAIKYTPEKGEIYVFISSKGKDIITQVTDNGYGIPKEQQVQTFQKFFRASNAVRKETEGTGLGLYLVKAIIESSGGKIWFESTEGKGTTFWFSLPIKGIPKKEGEIRLGS